MEPITAAPALVGPAGGEPEQAPRPLTRRENQVVRAVSEGLSNDQIARLLGISRWTVINHLRHVMWKWDCRSRVDVAVRHVSAARVAREDVR